jgi:F0F1-type ATP synthase assembly protein I
MLKGERVRGQTDRRQMNRGIGDGMSRSFELIVTPAVFGAIGYGLDRVLGILPVLTIVFGAFGVVGTFLSFWYRYDAQMRQHEAHRAESRRDEARGGIRSQVKDAA